MRPGLFIHLMSIETRKLFSYRVDFWVTTVVNMVVTLIVFWYLWEAMFQESGRRPSVAGHYQESSHTPS